MNSVDKPFQAALAFFGLTASWSPQELSYLGALFASIATAFWFGMQGLREALKLWRDFKVYRSGQTHFPTTEKDTL